jgi:saccharopine dehydrogenase-like NADP-dependent oxidoreductase
MTLFRETGLFNEEPVEINGVKVKPLDLTSAVLFPKWKRAEGQGDITILKLIISGEESGQEKTYVYSMFDVYDRKTGTLSMARTTGYTCTAVARAFLDGAFDQKGICPPEYVGRVEGCMARIKADLNDRGVIYKCTEESRNQVNPNGEVKNPDPGDQALISPQRECGSFR